jgi:phenylacetate-CoA ligase
MELVSTRSGMHELRERSWSWLLRRVILPIGDLAFGQKMMKRLRFLEEAQWWDSERLHTWRDRSLSSLIKVAYKEVPFYRDLMDSAGIKPNDICRAEDLYKLPIVTKEMLRSGYPQLVTRNTGKRVYETHTSGSTGTNFRVWTDAETDGRCLSSFFLALEWAGWRIGQPHLQTGISPNRGLQKWSKDILLRCHYVSSFNLSDVYLDCMLELLETDGIQHLWGYPASLYFLARHALKNGWNLPLRTIVTWGDNLYAHYRRTIEQAFKTKVFDTYGCSEGMQIAAQCGEMNTYHIHMLDVVVEYLDEEARPVSPGQPANLIVTRLHPGPMPLIRYRMGDVGIEAGIQMCKCARGFSKMESIQGRDTDVVITPSGNRLIVHFFTGILEYFSEIEAFQVLQDEPGSMVLRLVPTKGFSKAVAARIVAELKQKGASDMEVEIELVTEIPLPPSGKRRFVTSKLAKPLY